VLFVSSGLHFLAVYTRSEGKPEGKLAMLEVIASSVEDAIAAEQGGADRLELVRDLEMGGLTPPLELVRAVLAAVRIPVRVMLREEEDFFIHDQKKRERLGTLARSLSELSVAGLVIGFLTGPREAPQIDHPLLAQVLASAPGTNATFHRAFELLRDSTRAAQELKRHPQIDRILTSGCYEDVPAALWPHRLTGLAELSRVAAPEITILVGGGVDREVIESLCQKKTKLEFHVGRAVREPCSNAGVVRSGLVRELAALVKEQEKGGAWESWSVGERGS
jgi:copper homeostasis protein